MRERDRNFRDTRRRSPPPAKFRGGDTTNDNWQPGARRFQLEPERSRAISPVRRTERNQSKRCCNGGGLECRVDGRSSSITQYNKNAAHSESPSLKFQWNNLLDGKLENVPSSTKNPVSCFGYGISTTAEKPGFSQGDGFPDSGVFPIGSARSHRHIDGGFVSPVAKNEVGLPHKSKFPRPWHWEQQQQHGAVAVNMPRTLYRQGGETMPGTGVSLGYGISVSQPNASSSGNLLDNLRRSFQDSDLPRCSLGFNRSVGMAADGYFTQDVQGQMPKSNSNEISTARLMKLADSGRVLPCSVQVMDRDFNNSEMQRYGKGDTGIMLDNSHYRNMTATLQGEFRHQYYRRPNIVDSIVDIIDGIPNSHGDPLRQGVSWADNLSSEEHLTPRYHDLTQPSKHCVKLLGSRSMHPEYSTEGYTNSEVWSLKGYERDAYTTNYQDSWKGSPVLDHDQYFYKQEGIPDGMSITEELAMHDLDGEMFELKRGSITNENQIWTDFKTRLHNSQCASDTFNDMNFKEEVSFDEDIMHAQFDDRLTPTYPPVPALRKSINHKIISGKSMKKRLRPARTVPRPNSLVSSCRNVHERLGPRVVPTANPYARKYKKSRKLKRNLHVVFKTTHCSDLSYAKVKLTKTEPPEDSKVTKTKPPEDSKAFKQLVQNAFLKFVKLLNENPAQRRKYIDQGGISTLKCGVCGSKSKEFVNTLSLAMHAFKSSKAERRTEHLGFHKALCLLLGWSDTASSDGLWVQRMLPAAEASHLKNDLIIWPPVVLVHNSSIAHDNPNERIIVSIEGLEAILTGMGFDGGKMKVSRGKPANYSILVVTFNATFFGLQEAERLHKFYADSQHGRAEFQQIDGSGLQNSNEKTQYIPGNEESVLYGYIGNAGDLDKLDFESKKHYVVKSKKEIQDIAVATLTAY